LRNPIELFATRAKAFVFPFSRVSDPYDGVADLLRDRLQRI
jgi:hypothetical protein